MSKKLTVYIIDGTAYGSRLSEIENWVGKAIYSHRAAVNKIMNRSEFDNPVSYSRFVNRNRYHRVYSPPNTH